MNGPSLFPAMQIASTGLQAERQRMEVSANNLANANATRGADGQLYQRQVVLFSAVYEDSLDRGGPGLGGVEVEGVVPDNRPPIKIYAPYHPDADQDGMVEQANVSTIEEMMDIISASRAYQANLSALKQSREMAQKTIALGQAK
jgi:flagellar basal-body rod protein FlgC